MPDLQAIPIPGTKVLFGESPLWDGRRKELVFANCFANSVCVFHPSSGNLTSKVVKPLEGDEDFKYIVSGIPFSSSKDKFLVTTSTHKIYEFDWTTGETVRTLYNLNGLDLIGPVFEDAKCDSKGRLWSGVGILSDFGSITTDKGKGHVFKLEKCEKTGTLQYSKIDEGFNLPNGLGFNSSYTKLFYCDLDARLINVYDFDLENGKPSNRKVLFDFKNEPILNNAYPDGICVDANGNVWAACWKGGSVVKIDSATGKLLEKVNIAATNVTSLAFGGESYETLYVTTTSVELGGAQVTGEPEAGKLFEIRCEQDNSFKGYQESFFRF